MCNMIFCYDFSFFATSSLDTICILMKFSKSNNVLDAYKCTLLNTFILTNEKIQFVDMSNM